MGLLSMGRAGGVETVTFGSRKDAEQARKQYEPYLAESDDRRELTVRFESDTPDRVLNKVQGNAASTRDHRERKAGQIPLTRQEKKEIDFSKTDIFTGRSAKGIAAKKGVDDFLAHFDPQLTVDEHREVFESAKQQGGGMRMDAEPTAIERSADFFREAGRSEVEHAKKGAKMGDEEAISILREHGFSDMEIARLQDEGRAKETARQLSRDTPVDFRGVGDITPSEWATAKRSHEHRKREAQFSDEGKSAPLTENFEKWHDNPAAFDFPGVDTPQGTESFIDNEIEDEFNELTFDLWTWQ